MESSLGLIVKSDRFSDVILLLFIDYYGVKY